MTANKLFIVNSGNFKFYTSKNNQVEKVPDAREPEYVKVTGKFGNIMTSAPKLPTAFRPKNRHLTCTSGNNGRLQLIKLEWERKPL